jgi:hypothetical protein
MPLVVDQLSLWTISFRWAAHVPTGFWLRIPLDVRDYISTLLEAVLKDELECLTLSPEKYAGDDALLARCHIRYWLDDVYAAIHGERFNRKLLKWAVIERSALQDWCGRRTIPPPAFWFPEGWTEYRWPGEEEGQPTSSGVDPAPLQGEDIAETEAERLRPVVRFRTACQVIAGAIWREEPDKTIAAMVADERIQKYGGAQHYGSDAVRRWIKDVAPAEVSAKRGRPRKKNPLEAE